MPAIAKSIAVELVAFVRRRYAEGIPVAQIVEESELTIGAVYQCIDGVHDDGSGLPVPPLPRRKLIVRRRPPVRFVRATLVDRLWRAAEAQVAEMEKRLAREDLSAPDREGDARVFAIMVRTIQELKRCDAQAAPSAAPPKPTPRAHDDEPIPENLDEFRRRLAEKIDRLAAADAAAGADGA
jgi:hypothetical protein